MASLGAQGMLMLVGLYVKSLQYSLVSTISKLSIKNDV